MSSGILHLEDCLEDSPQTRALIGVFQQDADDLLNYAQEIHAACRRVSQAQNELAVSTQVLTQKLKNFQVPGPVGISENKGFHSTVQQLASSIDEICSYNTVLYSELSENMEYHSQRFLDKDLAEYLRLKSRFCSSDKTHEEASSKLARVSKKNKSEKSWQDATDQLYAARKSFHNTSMSYCCCLNDLQSKKQSVLLKPILSYLRSQIMYFRMGSDLSKPELEQVLQKLTEDLTKVEKESEENHELLVERMDRLDADSTRAYIPDPPASMQFPDIPIDFGKTQISGYLFYRSRSGLLAQWHRSYFFTQGGNLMQQNKKEVAGQLFMDLDKCSVSPFDVDDRRNVFQIVSSDGRHSCILQGQSKHQCEEWISTVKNISSGLYLEDNPREAIVKARQASISEPSTPEVSEPKTIARPSSKSEATPSPPPQAEKQRTSSFDKKHEAYKPSSMFARLRQAASSLMTPEEKEAAEASPSEPPPVVSQPPQETVSQVSGDGSLDAVLDASDPILFDLPSPISEQPPAPPSDQDKNEGDSNDKKLDGSNDDETSLQTRHNPFTSGDGDAVVDDSAFKAMFIVRFLGCKRTSSDLDLNGAISNTIWQVMTARALHKIFRMNELHLVVSDSVIRLVDPVTKLDRELFPISCVLKTKTHAENPRLLGFVAQRNDELLCYTFESNADGDDVCCAINTALVMQQSKIEHEESQKQREMENDLEEQSRMIAASVEAEPTDDATLKLATDDKQSDDASEVTAS